MNNLKKPGVFATFCLLIFCFAAQANDDNQFWSSIFINGAVNKDSRFLFWFDGHARFADDGSELGVSIIRPGIGWRASDKVNLWAGYARVTGHRDGPNIEEDRLWQQATYSIGSFFGGQLGGRTRLEQRTRDDDGDDTGLRLRQFFRWARPLENTRVSVVLANELFIGLNDADWGQRSGFDQNRAFLGLAWQLNPKTRIEGGYMSNYINGQDGADNRTNQILSLSLSYRLN